MAGNSVRKIRWPGWSQTEGTERQIQEFPAIKLELIMLQSVIYQALSNCATVILWDEETEAQRNSVFRAKFLGKGKARVEI